MIIESPWPRKDYQIDRLFMEDFLQVHTEIWKNEKLSEVLSVPQLEIRHIDTTKKIVKKPGPDAPDQATNEIFEIDQNQPLFIILTGWWGQGPQNEEEQKGLGWAMGENGLRAAMISLPEHGQSGPLKEGWNAPPSKDPNNPRNFDAAAKAITIYIEEIKKKYPDQEVIVYGWSMGCQTAMRTAAQRPDLVKGVILIDPPSFRMNFLLTGLRFFLYPTQLMRPKFLGKDKQIHAERPFRLQSKLKGLSIFLERWKKRNTPEGMSLNMLRKSGMALTKQDVSNDGPNGNEEGSTLSAFGKDRKGRENIAPGEADLVRTLVLYPGNNFVIPRFHIDRLKNIVRKWGGDIETVEITRAGHALIAEQPRRVGAIIRKWMEAKKLVKNAA